MEAATLILSAAALAVALVALYASSLAPAEVEVAFVTDRSGIPIPSGADVPWRLVSAYHLYAYVVNVGARGAVLVDLDVTGFAYRGGEPALWTRAEAVGVMTLPRPNPPTLHFMFPLPLPPGQVHSLMLSGNLWRDPPMQDDLEVARAVGQLEGFEVRVEWKVARHVGLPFTWRRLPAWARPRQAVIAGDDWVYLDASQNRNAVLASYREHGRHDLLAAAGSS